MPFFSPSVTATSVRSVRACAGSVGVGRPAGVRAVAARLSATQRDSRDRVAGITINARPRPAREGTPPSLQASFSQRSPAGRIGTGFGISRPGAFPAREKWGSDRPVSGRGAVRLSTGRQRRTVGNRIPISTPELPRWHAAGPSTAHHHKPPTHAATGSLTPPPLLASAWRGAGRRAWFAAREKWGSDRPARGRGAVRLSTGRQRRTVGNRIPNYNPHHARWHAANPPPKRAPNKKGPNAPSVLGLPQVIHTGMLHSSALVATFARVSHSAENAAPTRSFAAVT